MSEQKSRLDNYADTMREAVKETSPKLSAYEDKLKRARQRAIDASKYKKESSFEVKEGILPSADDVDSVREREVYSLYLSTRAFLLERMTDYGTGRVGANLPKDLEADVKGLMDRWASLQGYTLCWDNDFGEHFILTIRPSKKFSSMFHNEDEKSRNPVPVGKIFIASLIVSLITVFVFL